MSLKNNFIYSSILTVSKYLFPLIVYPYISRTLGLSNIGIVNFIDNIINYFVFVSMMGISTVGVREIAARKNNQDQLSKTFVSLLTLTAITTLIAIIALWVSMYTVPKLIPYQNLLYIGLVKLLFNFFLIEWFFTGMEEFKYITIRSILVKCAYVLSVFVLVRDASDYGIYYYTNDRNSCEIDFLLDDGEKVIPLEVKAEENLKAKSLKTYREKFKPALSIRASMASYGK